MGFIFGLAANLAKYISKTMASSDIADPYSPVIEIVSIGFSFGSTGNFVKYIYYNL